MSRFGLLLKDFVACLETRFDGINDERNLEDVRCDILEKFSLTCVLLPCGILDGVSNNIFSFGKIIFRLVLVKVREGFTFLGALLGLKACMPISASSNMQSRNLTLNKFCTSKSCSQRWAISLDFAAPRWSRSAIVVFPGGMSLEESIVSEFSTEWLILGLNCICSWKFMLQKLPICSTINILPLSNTSTVGVLFLLGFRAGDGLK